MRKGCKLIEPNQDKGIYIQEADVLAGRLQIFNHWSPDRVDLMGRSGMDSQNNQDHSMLTVMMPVDNIGAGRWGQPNIREVSTEMEYHETRKEAQLAAG